MCKRIRNTHVLSTVTMKRKKKRKSKKRNSRIEHYIFLEREISVSFVSMNVDNNFTPMFI